MHAIVKRALHFRHPSGERKKDIIVRASNDPQVVPDWVKETTAFAHATKDGSIYEVVPQKRIEPKEAPAPTDTGLSGDDKGNGKGKSKVAAT
jgi:hypothetical protein